MAAIIFPVFHIWDTDKVAQLCKIVHPTMSKAKFLELADASGAKIIGPTDDSLEGGKWQALAVSRSPLANKICVIRGTANKVAFVNMVNKEDL